MSERMCMAIVLTALIASPVLAQDQGGQPRGGGNNQDGGGRGGRGGGGGGFDPARFREQFENTVKEQLGANDDEWKILQPKLTKVFDAQRATRGNMRGMFGRNRGGGGGGDNNNTADNTNRSPVEIAQRELQQVLDNKDAPADQITTKLKALREAREKAKTELASAQKDLKELLTPRQEAVLVNMGMLD